MRVGLYQKFFTWAMLNLVLLGVITALFIGGVLLFNNNLYSPMLFNGSIASTFRMTSVELQYKPESQWASVLEECGRECGLHFGILILDDMDPPLAAGGLPPRVVEAARTIPRPPYSLCAEPDSGAFSTITPAVELEAGILPQQYVIFMRDGDPAQYWYARTILVSNDEGVVRYVLLAASSPSITGNGHFFELRLAVALLLSGLGLSFLWWWPFVRHLTKPIILMTKVTERIAAGDYSSLSDDSPISLKAVGEGRGDQIGCLAKARASWRKRSNSRSTGSAVSSGTSPMSWIRRWPGSSSGSPCWTAVWTRKTSSAYRKSATKWSSFPCWSRMC